MWFVHPISLDEYLLYRLTDQLRSAHLILCKLSQDDMRKFDSLLWLGNFEKVASTHAEFIADD
jgi:hypothetical protein